nr:MAG TPA: minor tail protein [Caudoviricetes sp.]
MAAEAQLSFVIDTTKATQNLAQLSEMADSVYDQIQKQGSQGMLDLEAQQIQKDAKSIIKSIEKVQNEADKLVLTTNIEAFYNSLNKLRDKAKDLKLDLDIPEFSFNIDNAEISDLKSIKDLSRKLRDSISKQLDFDLQKFDVLNDKTKNAFKKSINKSVEGLFSVLKSPAKDVDINKTIEEYMNTVFSAGALDAGFRKKRDIAGKFTSQFEKMFSDEDILKTLADNNISIDGIKAQWESKINDIEAIKAMQAQLYNTAIGNQSSNITSFGKIFTNDDIEAMKSEGKTVEELKLQLKSLVSTFQQLGNFNDAGTKGNAGIDEFYNTLLDIQSIVSKINDTGIEKIDIKSLLGTDSVNILKEARSEMKNSIDYLNEKSDIEGAYNSLFDTLFNQRRHSLLPLSKDNFSSITEENAAQYLDTVNSIIATIQRVDSVEPNGLINVLGSMSEAFEMRGSLISRMKELGIEISEVDEKANSAVASIAKMYGISMSSGTGSGTENGSQNNGTGSGNGSGNSTSNGSGVSSEEMNEIKSKLDQTQTALTNVEARLQTLEGKNDTDVINAVNSIQGKINTLQDQINKIPTEKIDLSQLNGINEILNKLIPTLEALDTDSLIDLAKNINGVSISIKSLENNIEELQAIVTKLKPGIGLEELTQALAPVAKTEDVQNINSAVEKAVESINEGTEKIVKAKEHQQEALNTSITSNSPTNPEAPIVPDISGQIDTETAEIKASNKKLQEAVQEVQNSGNIQDHVEIKTEEAINQELYKESEAYKTLADAVENYNTLTAQHIGKTDFDARIKRLQDMQACVEKIIAGVENYEGKANELSSLMLQSKNGNMSIQDGTKLDALMDKLQSGVNKNIEKENQFAQLKEEAQKFETIVNEYEQKFQNIISHKTVSGKQFNTMKQNLQDMSNSLDTIMGKYNDLKGQDFYSSDFASRIEATWSKVKDASLDLSEISKYKGSEEEVLAIQAKYSESLKKQKQEQDAVAESARKKAEAEKQALKAIKLNEAVAPKNISVAEKSREEQKRKVLERQTAQNTIISPDVAGSSQQEIVAIDKTVQALTGHIQDKNNAIRTEAEIMKSAATTEVAELNRIQQKVIEVKNSIAGTGAVGKITMPDNSEVSVPKTNSGDTTLLTSEISAVNSLKDAFKNTETAVNNKTAAIKTEADTMATAAASEVSEVTKISNAVTDLANKIAALPKINVTGELNVNKPINIAFNYDEAQIAAIREKIIAVFNASNPIPVEFSPNVVSLREQIEKGLSKIPVTVNSNTQNIKVTNIKIDSKAITELKDKISKRLTNIEIQTFAIKSDARKKLISDLKDILNNIGLAFDTTKIRKDIKNAIQATQDSAKKEIENGNSGKKGGRKPSNVPSEKLLEKYNKYQSELNKVAEAVNKYKADGYSGEFESDFNDIQALINALGTADTTKKDILTEWNQKSDEILIKWKSIKEQIDAAENYRITHSGKSNYEAIIGAGNDTKNRSKYSATKRKQISDIYTTFKNSKADFTDSQFNEIDKKYTRLFELIDEVAKDKNKFTIESLEAIDKEKKSIAEMINMFRDANSGKGQFALDTNRINSKLNDIELRSQNTQDSTLDSQIASLRAKLSEYARMSQNVGSMDYSGIQKYAQLVADINEQFKQIQNTNTSIQQSFRNENSMNKTAAKMDDLIFKMKQFVEQNSRINSNQSAKSQYEEMLKRAETLPRTAANWQMMTKEFNAFKTAVTSKGLTGRSVGDELRFIFEKIGIKAILGNQVYRIIGYFRQMVSIVKEIDTGMTVLKRVTSEADAAYNKFLTSAMKNAAKLGSTVTDVINATSEFSKLGYNLGEAESLGKSAVTYANVGFMDTESAIESLSSVIQAFKINAQDSMNVVDKMNLIGNRYAIDSKGVGDALQRSASSLVAAGNDLDEAIALITAGNTVLQDPESVANGIKVIGMRIRGKLCCHHIKKLICSHAKSEMITI